jgi:hypothetical protein
MGLEEIEPPVMTGNDIIGYGLWDHVLCTMYAE